MPNKIDISIENNEEIIVLFEKYKNFLTPKQQKIMELKFIEDLSYQEIATILEISRPAIADSIKKSIEKMQKTQTNINL